MNKRHFIILTLTSLIIVVMFILSFVSRRNDYSKYIEDGTINFESVENDTSWFKDTIDLSVIENYNRYVWVSEYVMRDEDYPEWIIDMYSFYPEDALIYAQLYDVVRGNCIVFDLSDSYAYYSFNGCTTYVIDIDGIPNVFTISDNCVYHYLLSDEIVK